LRLLCSFLTLSACLFALSLEELRDKPPGYAKDLFLLRLMEQNNTKNEAYESYFLSKTPKSEHSTLLLKKSGSKKLSKLFDCMDTNLTRALKKTPECAELGVNYKKISTSLLTNPNESLLLAEHIKEAAPQKSSKIELLSNLTSKKQHLDKELINVYFETSKEFRAAFFDLELGDTELASILDSQSSKRFIKWVLFDKNAAQLQKSVSKIECKDASDGETLFFLSLLKLKNLQNTTGCFEKAAKNSKNESDRDRANFWAYLTSDNAEFLKKVANSKDTNFYSLAAKEKLNIELKNIEFVETNDAKRVDDINISSPFLWQDFRAKIKHSDSSQLDKILKKYADIKDGDAYYLYAKDKKEGYKKELFLLPYKENFADFNASQKTLLHAIGRQESLFVPGVVSSAYATGVMQIIPILAEELAVKRKEKLDFFELFEPKKNISYAATHFKWLEEKVKHPTLIAVSYNAGYGFFRRIQREGLFVFKDEQTMPYEPFWSIENIPYDETRNYAKKVSLNYAVYSEKFGEKISLTQLLESLVQLRHKE
jgi:soluble lytic murein transglycosylase